MNNLDLSDLELKTFTEQDVEDYCQINNINPDDITVLDLFNNELIDISGIKLFKNLKELCLNNNKLTDIFVIKHLKNLEKLYLLNNKIKDISGLKDLTKLERLNLNNNEIKDISVLKDLNNLESLYISNNELTNISVIQYLKQLMILGIRDLKLESNQIEYIKSLKKLENLWCYKGFKDMNVLNQLNNNIKLKQ